MAFLRRLLFYIIGIGLGVLIVFAFFGDRDLDYAYGPQARVKKLFRTKAVDSTTLVHEVLDLSQDSLYYRAVREGKVRFGKSDTRKEPCGEDILFVSFESYPYELTLENCKDTVRVLDVVRVQD